MRDDSDYGVSFVSLPGMAAIEVIDPIERHRYRLETPSDVSPEPIGTSDFHFPVDRAVSVETTAFELPNVVATYIRTSDGHLVAEAEHHAEVSLSEDEYVIELCSPVKLYLEYRGEITITADQDTMRFGFGSPVEVAIGARSAHKQPEATVTATTDPSDLMAAIASFGSALKTLSPERSFPSLRGHPPRLELGDELDVPSALEPPAAEITLALRPAIRPVFEASTLAYYLGADMVPANRNQLCIDGETVLELGDGDRFRRTVSELLTHTFLLDCVVRTEGLYPVTLSERERLLEQIDLDLAELYDRPIGPRTRAYLSVPFEATAELRPRWGTTAHMVPDPDHAALLPYVVDDLGLVHVHDPSAVDRPASPAAAVDPTADGAGAFTRSAGSTTADTASYVRPPPSNSADQLWIGDGTPIGASKAIPEAFEHRLDRTPTASNIDITVVCNDPRMNEERGLIDEIYGSRDDVRFEVSVHQDVTRSGLTELLAARSDFFHYIGHIDDEGFECTDGKLDVADIDEVGVSSFLLNACQSYHQGRFLVERGAIGGIVTLSDVINEGAVRIGGTLAACLNLGFPLYAALDVGQRDSLMGGRYIIVGDGRVALTQPRSIPHLNKLSTDDPIEFSYMTFPTRQIDLGSITMPGLDDEQVHYLISNEIDDLSPTQEALREFLQIERSPVYLDGELTWSDEVDCF